MTGPLRQRRKPSRCGGKNVGPGTDRHNHNNEAAPTTTKGTLEKNRKRRLDGRQSLLLRDSTESTLLLLLILSLVLFLAALWLHMNGIVVEESTSTFDFRVLAATGFVSRVGVEMESWWWWLLWNKDAAAPIYHWDDFQQGAGVEQEARNDKKILPPHVRRAFRQDGVVAIRGLLPLELLHRLDAAAHDWMTKEKQKRAQKPPRGSQFYLTKMGAAIHGHHNTSAFRDVALHSILPQVAAELLDIHHHDDSPRLSQKETSNVHDDDDDSNVTLHMLRDVFLAKNEEEYICGWHVDDVGFWPATAESPGVNAWIALDDMPSAFGGGLALAVGSHEALWRHDAYRATGATPTRPAQGFTSAADWFANRTGAGTCNLKTAAPHLHQAMERRKRVFDVHKGDVIFHTRWLFHRTVPFDREHVRQRQQQGEADSLLYRRYSIRYAPGTARLPRGYGTELSILWNPDNAGKRLTQVEGPWYPQCWPPRHHEEDDESWFHDKMPVAQALLAQRQAEMKPYLRQMSAAQQRQRQRQEQGQAGWSSWAGWWWK